jgi:tetratricopeptide (TPR) repeat protein
MAPIYTCDATIALVHEGWNHLMSQRPLAAWGTWQRVLKADPDSAQARQALRTLESAPDLPLAARKVYRFRKPRGESQRARWDVAFRSADHSELANAAQSFGRLATEFPDDADAWFNQGLCFAWSGQDRQAIASLDQAANLDADADASKAVEAWVLAEILRQGGGAESLSDDLRYACTFPWDSTNTERLEAAFPEIRRIPTPHDPTRLEDPPADLEVLEWLDRPFPAADSVNSQSDIPRVMTTVYIAKGSLRLSSPRVDTLEQVEEKLRRVIGSGVQPIERVAAPLPLPFLDAEIWTTRIPEGVERALCNQLARETVESFYENHWIHRPRQGLDGLSPLAASQCARRGDAVARVKLEAVVRLREQLGSRPSAIALYQGYPFDRLRRRLDLEACDPSFIDEQDLSCASESELQALNTEELEDRTLADAFESASGLRDDALTARFARELLRRTPSAFDQLDLAALYAPLIRQDLERGNSEAALELLDRARTLGSEKHRRTFDTWRAEILSRTDRAEEAASIYRELIASSCQATGPQVALDAAETLLDNEHREQAESLLHQALDLARTAQVGWIEKQATALLKAHS